MTANNHFGLAMALCLGAVLSPTAGLGGAWTQPEGAGLVISKVEYFNASASYDGAGAPAPGEFHKLHVETYGEFGLTDAVTLIGQIDYDTSWLETKGEPAISEGFGRFCLWGRARVWTGGAGVASVQAGVELPGDRSGVNAPALGAEPAAISVRGLYGRGFTDSWGAGYVDLQAGFALRDEDAPMQANFELTAGHWLWSDILVMGQLFNTFSLDRRPDDPQDYDETKAALSIGWRALEDTTIVLGASADLATRNLEPTRAVLLSVWKSF